MRTATSLALLCLGLTSAAAVLATTSTDADFSSAFAILYGWSQGTLGRVVTLGMLVVGIAVGMIKQSLWVGAASVTCAVSLLYAPSVVDNLFGALV